MTRRGGPASQLRRTGGGARKRGQSARAAAPGASQRVSVDPAAAFEAEVESALAQSGSALKEASRALRQGAAGTAAPGHGAEHARMHPSVGVRPALGRGHARSEELLSQLMDSSRAHDVVPVEALAEFHRAREGERLRGSRVCRDPRAVGARRGQSVAERRSSPLRAGATHRDATFQRRGQGTGLSAAGTHAPVKDRTRVPGAENGTARSTALSGPSRRGPTSRLPHGGRPSTAFEGAVRAGGDSLGQALDRFLERCAASWEQAWEGAVRRAVARGRAEGEARCRRGASAAGDGLTDGDGPDIVPSPRGDMRGAGAETGGVKAEAEREVRRARLGSHTHASTLSSE